MTFYNVLSGFVIIAAFGNLTQTIYNFTHPGSVALAPIVALTSVLMSFLVLLLAVNDAVWTCHVIEGNESTKYTAPLMIMDLAGFVLLVLALSSIPLPPSSQEPQDAMAFLGKLLSSEFYWLFVACFWAVTIFWTFLTNAYKEDPVLSRLLPWSFSLLGLFIFVALTCAVIREQQSLELALFLSAFIGIAATSIYIGTRSCLLFRRPPEENSNTSSKKTGELIATVLKAIAENGNVEIRVSDGRASTLSPNDQSHQKRNAKNKQFYRK